MLARFNGCRVARDVSDQLVGMKRGDETLMGEVGEFGLGEFGEGAREGGFVGQLMGLGPAAKTAKTFVGAQSVEELAGGPITEDSFGEERPGDGQTVFAGPAIPAAAGEIASERHHGAGSDEERVAVADWSDCRFQMREEFLLQQMGELRYGIGKGNLHVFNT